MCAPVRGRDPLTAVDAAPDLALQAMAVLSLRDSGKRPVRGEMGCAEGGCSVLPRLVFSLGPGLLPGPLTLVYTSRVWGEGFQLHVPRKGPCVHERLGEKVPSAFVV